MAMEDIRALVINEVVHLSRLVDKVPYFHQTISTKSTEDHSQPADFYFLNQKAKNLRSQFTLKLQIFDCVTNFHNYI